MSDKTGFLKLNSDSIVDELMKSHICYILTTIIARKAKRTSGFSLEGLQAGEALITVTDLRDYNISRQQFITAQKKLEDWGIATFHGYARVGTVASLCNKKIWIYNNPLWNKK